MKRVLKDIAMLAITAATLMMIVGGALAHAETAIDNNKNPNIFKVSGREVTPIEAMKAAVDHDVTRCTPKKNVTDINGKQLAAYTCKQVILVFNPKTGVPHWKTK